MFKKSLSLLSLLFSIYCFASSEIPVVHLTPPKIGPEFIAEDILCKRPMRNGCFKVAAEIQHEKLIIHNYGAGGSGWSLLFGLVRSSIEQFEKMVNQNPQFANQPVRIVGAGCMGLLTAVLLKLKGYNVEITAKDLTRLASHNAVGILGPIAHNINPEEQDFFNTISVNAYKEWAMIAKGEHPLFNDGGVHMPIFVGKTTDAGLEHYVQKGLIDQPQEVIVDFGNGKRYNMLKYITLFIDTKKMMGKLHTLIDKLEIKVTQAVVESFKEIKEAVVFNCSGLGARELAEDRDVVPVVGHLLMLKNQPPMKELQYIIDTTVHSMNDLGQEIEEYIYYAPKGQGILGGTFIKGTEATRNLNHHFSRLTERSMNYFGTPTDE